MIKSDLEKILEDYPSLIAGALLIWRKATADRQRIDAKLSISFRGEDPSRTATEVKDLVHNSQAHYDAVMNEATAESTYNAKYETLMSAKRLAGLREAF